MTDDFSELDNVGPARSEYLEEAGYESFEDLADTEPDDVAEDIDVPNDTALGLIVQAQNIVEEREAEVEESEPDVTEEDLEEMVEEMEEMEEEVVDEEVYDEEVEDVEEEPKGEETFEVELSLDKYSHEALFHAAMQQKVTLERTNRKGEAPFDHILDTLRNNDDGEVLLLFEEDELNNVHNAVRKKRIDYKGDNLIQHMEAMEDVLASINDVRERHLF
jgi:hypothetical protein